MQKLHVLVIVPPIPPTPLYQDENFSDTQRVLKKPTNKF